MNERIRLLAEQAGAKFPFGGFVNYDQFDCEKFAELIVKECAEVARDRVSIISTRADAEYVEERIQEHFGVEE